MGRHVSADDLRNAPISIGRTEVVCASIEEEIRRNLRFLRDKLEADLYAERKSRGSAGTAMLLSISIF